MNIISYFEITGRMLFIIRKWKYVDHGTIVYMNDKFEIVNYINYHNNDDTMNITFDSGITITVNTYETVPVLYGVSES